VKKLTSTDIAKTLLILAFISIILFILFAILQQRTKSWYHGSIYVYNDCLYYNIESDIYKYQPGFGESLFIENTDYKNNYCINRNVFYYVKSNGLYALNLDTNIIEQIYKCKDDESMKIIGIHNNIVKIQAGNDAVSDVIYITDEKLVFKETYSFFESKEEWNDLEQQYEQYDDIRWDTMSENESNLILKTFPFSIDYVRKTNNFVYFLHHSLNEDNLYCCEFLYSNDGQAYEIRLLDVLSTSN